MWGKITIPMYRLWLHSLYGLYGPRCPLSPEKPLNLITDSLFRHVSLTCFTIWIHRYHIGDQWFVHWPLLNDTQSSHKLILNDHPWFGWAYLFFAWPLILLTRCRHPAAFKCWVGSRWGLVFLKISPGSHTRSATRSWRRYQMKTFFALLALSEGNSPVTSGLPQQRPVTRSFDIFFVLRLNKRLSKQSPGWWFETPSCPLWRHCNEQPWLLSQSSREKLSRMAHAGWDRPPWDQFVLNRWLSARLHYLQCVNNGDIAVLHWAIE